MDISESLNLLDELYTKVYEKYLVVKSNQLLSESSFLMTANCEIVKTNLQSEGYFWFYSMNKRSWR